MPQVSRGAPVLPLSRDLGLPRPDTRDLRPDPTKSVNIEAGVVLRALAESAN